MTLPASVVCHLTSVSRLSYLMVKLACLLACLLKYCTSTTGCRHPLSLYLCPDPGGFPSLLCHPVIFCLIVLWIFTPLLGCHSQFCATLGPPVVCHPQTMSGLFCFCFRMYSAMSATFVLFLVSEHGKVSASKE